MEVSGLPDDLAILSPGFRAWVGSRAGLEAVAKRKILALQGIETRPALLWSVMYTLQSLLNGTPEAFLWIGNEVVWPLHSHMSNVAD
jgi:hypothetical protein